jgi:hypothetical protein
MDMEFAMDMHYERAENAYTQALDEADELRRQRDEALRALRAFVDAHRHNVYSNLTYTPYVEACRILTQYDKDGDA